MEINSGSGSCPRLVGHHRAVPIRLLIREVHNVGGLSRLLGAFLIMHRWRVLLYVRIKLIFRKRPSIPVIKVKQKRCRQTD
jgi:hypothetical protein